MAKETSKANFLRRSKELCYINKYFAGNGIDVGAGANPLNFQHIGYCDSNMFGFYRFFKKNSLFPKIDSVKIYSSDWDKNNEAEFILTREKERSYDFCYSSNLLEHVKVFQRSLLDFSLITKVNGYLIISVPDFELYEKEIWPPIKNNGHISCFSLDKNYSINTHYNLSKTLSYHYNLEIVKLEIADSNYDYSITDKNLDQTDIYPHGAECFVEFVAKVLPDKNYNNFSTITVSDFLREDTFDNDILVIKNELTETEKLRILNLPYTETYLPLADNFIVNNFPVLINKNYVEEFKKKLIGNFNIAK